MNITGLNDRSQVRRNFAQSFLPVSVLGIVAGGMLSGSAEALTFKFKGTVKSFEFNNGITQDGSVSLGTKVKGKYTFDCLPSDCIYEYGSYSDPTATSGASVKVGNYHFRSVPFEGFGPAPASMQYNMFFTDITNWLTIGIEEAKDPSLDMNRVSPTGGSYSAISMSSSDPFALGSISILSSQGMFQFDPDVAIGVEVTSIRQRQVPEPASTLSLLVVGSLALLSRCRKNQGC
ncbi:PEP-CTERM sorting domain-containing protein [Roseofilum casamattae]|uniref:PEP-CTERM sorting domain-containing protein n=1 Tax=Roseofilum casamattae BLCC-M143 TaxID=3022442 RepID=A0ABT7BYF1_9CYAN|nr:PEP-CTERM sorting domain-containing protein [Roseofilum casamattae]MDJ1184100.1 PEP-CTERM sorting domain-containing protein [Roseofilum casamattae BLCC-M143]